MKLRTGFVSNSSSSSFVISRKNLTDWDVERITNHSTEGEEMGISFAATDPWSIEVSDVEVKGSTFMDNFDMEEFLRRIGVHPAAITWDE